MIEKLNDYRDRWIDKEVTLVGSGPIHFIWFTGARNILGVGINPATAALGHDSRIGGGTPTRQMQFIANRMVEDLAFFGLSVRYA